jgi:hypothetical protein
MQFMRKHTHTVTYLKNGRDIEVVQEPAGQVREVVAKIITRSIPRRHQVRLVVVVRMVVA